MASLAISRQQLAKELSRAASVLAACPKLHVSSHALLRRSHQPRREHSEEQYWPWTQGEEGKQTPRGLPEHKEKEARQDNSGALHLPVLCKKMLLATKKEFAYLLLEERGGGGGEGEHLRTAVYLPRRTQSLQVTPWKHPVRYIFATENPTQADAGRFGQEDIALEPNFRWRCSSCPWHFHRSTNILQVHGRSW